MKVRTYHLGDRGVRVALMSDLHNRPREEMLTLTQRERPDFIAIAGDLTYRFDQHEKVGGFLSGCARIAPTFVSLGNHDSLDAEPFFRAVTTSGAILLDDCYVVLEVRGQKLRLGGLSAPTSYQPRIQGGKITIDRNIRKRRPWNLAWLEDFCASEDYKILLCHQPEFYPRRLAAYPMDLVLAGHAHGGQWRIGKQGIYAPGQGLLPKLTGGVVEGLGKARLVISRGLSNPAWAPRLGNPCEIVMLEL